ncbi:DUF4136 domain-containing protein [Sinomicrobium soli]|uniref:DUF4136 domain-containing protein n=1 Tax=Sinomicrobium sp. N-1-3-6 TaxID=2219864 RepID=UPI000DCF54CD|nr:DUF4136 domain-containing protein [Sinomicrobium sp. N-1-3-6]RAV30484.1 DUF4136 domain-containing protein [Sinomicrobium sp. N-1-3-6]
MKPIRLLPLMILALVAGSCASVRVAADYDRQVNFAQYRTFAFFKPGIDKAEISDLDKKRILRAIEAGLTAKGLTKSDNPDMLVSIFTTEKERVDVYNNYGWGWGWNPYWWGMAYPNVSTSTEGSLFIDFIDAGRNELVWQGKGTGYLTSRMDKKDERIREFVNSILEKYPPGMDVTQR